MAACRGLAGPGRAACAAVTSRLTLLRRHIAVAVQMVSRCVSTGRCCWPCWARKSRSAIWSARQLSARVLGRICCTAPNFGHKSPVQPPRHINSPTMASPRSTTQLDLNVPAHAVWHTCCLRLQVLVAAKALPSRRHTCCCACTCQCPGHHYSPFWREHAGAPVSAPQVVWQRGHAAGWRRACATAAGRLAVVCGQALRGGRQALRVQQAPRLRQVCRSIGAHWLLRRSPGLHQRAALELDQGAPLRLYVRSATFW